MCARCLSLKGCSSLRRGIAATVLACRLFVISLGRMTAYFQTMMKILAMILLATAAPACAQTSDDVLHGSILPGWQTAKGSHMSAVHLDLAPGWKTYWRAPGDAGIPPSFDWSGSQNIRSVQFHWPAPSVFHNNGMQSIGYHDSLTLPVEIIPEDPSAPVSLRVEMQLGICDEICVPASLSLTADLLGPGASDTVIKSALKAQPVSGNAAGVKDVSCEVDPIADGLRVTATLAMPRLGQEETIVFETHRPEVWVAQSMTSRDGNRLTAVTEMVEPSGAPFMLDRSKIILTVLSGGRAVEIAGCPAP